MFHSLGHYINEAIAILKSIKQALNHKEIQFSLCIE